MFHSARTAAQVRVERQRREIISLRSGPKHEPRLDRLSAYNLP